jgi:hypothetical protein
MQEISFLATPIQYDDSEIREKPFGCQGKNPPFEKWGFSSGLENPLRAA